MLSSIADNLEPINQVLLRSGLRDLRLDDVEKELLVAVRDFLTPFEEYTNMVSTSGSSLSLLVLIRKDIIKRTKPNNATLNGVKLLKDNIAKNIDKRLKINHTVLMATLMDPSTKKFAGGLVTMNQLDTFCEQMPSTSSTSSAGQRFYCHSPSTTTK